MDEMRIAQGDPITGGRVIDSETRRGVIRWAIREGLGILVVALSLFLSAGRLDWPMGWGLVAVYAGWATANAVVLIPRCPELLAERATRRRGAKSWDAAILSVIGLSTLAKHILAGLDFRYGWSAGIPLWAQLLALTVSAAGYALGTWAMISNAFFSLVGRIQADRGHVVVTGGPYRYVRHPAYTGTTAFELLTPIALGSWWALIPGALNAVLTVARTALEDGMLRTELAGYEEYAARTPFRLLPGVW